MYSSNSNCYGTPKRNNSNKNENKHEVNKSQKKGNHIIELKNELVKMKQYLNTEMPQINKIVPIRNSNQKLPPRQYQTDLQQQLPIITNQQINVLLNANMRLKNQNSFLASQLHKEKDMYKRLNKSLKKHEQILHTFYEKQKQQLRTTSQSKKIQKRYKIHEQSDEPIYHKLQNKKKSSSKYQRLNSLQNRQSNQIVNIWHSRKNSGIKPINSARYGSQTSIMDSKEKGKKSKIKICIKKPERTPGFTETDLQTIQIMQQINELEQKMQNLLAQCKQTQSKAKKLHIRYQIQKITNRIHFLKQTIDNKY